MRRKQQTVAKKEPTLSFSDIHPFRIQVPQSDLDDLNERLNHTRWPDELLEFVPSGRAVFAGSWFLGAGQRSGLAEWARRSWS